jgi:putative endonuclease
MNIVYLLRCADGTLYCGWTTDMESRLEAHNAGKGAKYTRSRRPVELVYTEEYEDRHEALSREWHIKRMSRAEKEKLIGQRDGSSVQLSYSPR